MSACPANAENITALIVYYLTLKRWPPLDQNTGVHSSLTARQSTIIASGARISTPGNTWKPGATRRIAKATAFTRWDARGRRPRRTVRSCKWNEGTNWPIGCGHPCVGCAEPNFWDTMTPFYQRLPNVAGFDVGGWVDPVGLGLTGLVAAAVGIARCRRDRTPSPRKDTSQLRTKRRSE